jgi:pyruvate dehydrogenase E2 component (dihydrolipoamide acetyltransferase)
MVTVENREDVKAFASFTADAAPAAVSPPQPPVTPTAVPQTPVSAPVPVPSPAPSSGDRIFASPLARTLAREAALDLSLLPAKGYASGPNGRIIGADVRGAIASGVASQAAPAASAQPVPAVAPSQSATPATQLSSPVVAGGSLQELFILSKRTVPHYFLSVEVNLSKIQALRAQLGAEGEALSVQDFLVKAAAKAMAKVPEVNAAWMDSFVRKYDQVQSLSPFLFTHPPVPSLRSGGHQLLRRRRRQALRAGAPRREQTRALDHLQIREFPPPSLLLAH